MVETPSRKELRGELTMKKTYAPFENILATIHQNGIATKAILMDCQELYSEFWFVASAFANFCLHSKTNGIDKDGNVKIGNAGKIEALVSCGFTTREDIQTDCVIRILDKLDLVLCQPLEAQYNYVYKMVNNVVNDQFRKLPPKEVSVVSFQETIKGKTVSPENECTYEDMIGDYSYNGESCYVEQETIDELTTALQKKRSAERENERNEVVREIKQLVKKPAEVLVHMATAHLGIKPRELAERIATKGGEVTYAEILFDVAKKVDLEISELRSLVKNVSFSEKSIKADTRDAKIIAKQVSRLVWRAKDNLKK